MIRSFNAAFLKRAFFGFYYSNWHPITMVSYAMDYSAWGLDPMGYHMTNILLHSANTFLVVVLVFRLIEKWEATGRPSGLTSRFLGANGKPIAAVATGLLFGLHPLHVESVAWASERKDVLCGLFFLLSMLAYIKYANRNFPEKLPSALYNRHYLLCLALFAFALMSKAMAVSLPMVLLILDWFPLGRIFSLKSFGAAFYEKLPFIALSVGDSVLTILAQKKSGAMVSFSKVPFIERLPVAARSLVLYLWKMVLPMGLVPFYPYPKHASPLSFRYFIYVIGIVTITVFCLIMAKRRKIWIACWGYYVITLLPVLGIIQVGQQAMADRYAYLPSLGPFLAVGVTTAWTLGKAGRFKQSGLLTKVSVTVALLAVLSMSHLTFRQIGIWKNSLVFWNYVVRKEPYKTAIAYNGRGLVFEKMGRTERAIADFKTAIRLSPSFAVPYNNIGLSLEKAGQIKRAITDFTKAIVLNPAYFRAYYNLGGVLLRAGQPSTAITEYDKAIALNPSYEVAYNDRGVAFYEAGQTNRAIADYNQAIALNPSDFKPYNNLGIIFKNMGFLNISLTDFNKAILLNPDEPELYVNRGKVYVATGLKKLATLDFQKACGMGNEEGCRSLREMDLNGN